MVLPLLNRLISHLIQIPWYHISDSTNPFRHRAFFAAASDSCGAPVLLGWYGQVVEKSVSFVVPAEKDLSTVSEGLSKMRQQKRPCDSITARVFEYKERLFHDSDKIFLGRGDKRPRLVQLLNQSQKET